MSDAAQQAMRETVGELHRYLSGELAPMMVVDCLEAMSHHPADFAAAAIASWIEGQHWALGQNVPVPDLVYHSMKKLHLLSEMDLVGAEPLMRFLEALTPLLVRLCPEEERIDLKLRLTRLGEPENETISTTDLQYLHRDGGAGSVSARENRGGSAGDMPKEIRKLSLLIERLANLKAPAAPAGSLGEDPVATSEEVLARFLSIAATEARSGGELDGYLEQIRGHGGAIQMNRMFRALGASLPGWILPDAAGSAGLALGAGAPVAAMEKMVALAPDAEEGARRFGELVYAAIEQFNEGRLAQAAAMLDTASRLLADKRVDPERAKLLLSKAQDAVQETTLRKFSESPEKHGLLRHILEFFPAYRAEGMLDRLCREEKRESRKLLLVLLECLGTQCRGELLERLAACDRGDVQDSNGWFRRNLVFLLRRIPRAEPEASEEEIALLRATIADGEPLLSAREAIGALGPIRHPLAEKALVDRLKELEEGLASGGVPAGEEAWDLLDRLCTALAGRGTKTSIRTVAAHAFGRHPAFGQAIARIEHLSKTDLTADPEQLGLLVGTLRNLLPVRVLGFVVKRSTAGIAPLLRAISGTQTPDVRAICQEIAHRFEGGELGAEAAKILARLEPRARPQRPATKTMTGDLELFAVPNLLQSLADTQATGELALFDVRQTRRASFAFAGGRIASCEAGKLRAEVAVYQILEEPFPGTFVFRGEADGGSAPAASEDLFEILPILLEGVRRHDEFRAARAIAPDGSRYEPTGKLPVNDEEESDKGFSQAVWAQASSGVSPETCEGAVTADAYSVRTLYANWLEQEVLRPIAAAAR